MNPAHVISVALIEDEKEVRQGLSFILNHTEGFRCIADFKSYEDALATLTSAPDVLLSDIGLPGMQGDEGARRFKERFPSAAIVMLTVHGDDDRIFRSICAGATGYILKKEPPARILDAIREVYSGGASMSSETAMRVLSAFRALVPRKSENGILTKREEDVLEELVKGNSYKSIADHLFLSVHTVRFHIRSIYEKLHVHSKSEAVAKILREKML
ncbi:MAG: response regulator transcription factor [Bacteroidota bacterium]